MKKNNAYILVACFVLAGIAAAFVWTRTFIRRPLPNIVLITVDALRADRLGCYGYERDTSPFLDALSKKAVLFKQAIAVSSYTPPSVTTILTGRYPHQHGVRNWGHVLNDVPTLPRILDRMGYRTVFLGGNGHFKRVLPGFSVGFHDFYELTHSESVTKRAIEYLDAVDRPFFMWIHYMNTHVVYTPLYGDEVPFMKDPLYDPADWLPAVKPLYDHYGYKGIVEDLIERSQNNHNPDYYRALYDGAVRTVDRHIQDLVSVLQRKKIFDNTVLIITSDHGEMLGEHELYFHHGWYLYEQLIKVPLIVKPAGAVQARVVTQQVAAHLDIAPTIMACVRRRPYSWMRGEDLLSGLTKAKNDGRVFSDEGFLVRSVRTGSWKLIWYREDTLPYRYEMFDMQADPQETADVQGRYPEVFSALRRSLAKFIEEADSSSKPVMDPLYMNIDEDAKERLRSLGYMH